VWRKSSSRSSSIRWHDWRYSHFEKTGLNPILVHGGGLGIKKKLDELNIESKFIMGLRVTDEKIITIVEEVMIEFNKKIIKPWKKNLVKQNL
jgi:acetylglutamate kinase